MSESIFQPGQEIENFVIEKQIGRGGMAELFLAKDAALKRKVVLKALNPRFSNSDRFKKYFLQEARIQANLDNPHIVQILSMLEYHDHFCLVMQHIDGTDLSRVIEKAKSVRQMRGEKGALSLERAIHIFLQILEGIGFVHKYRIIHGDVKPSNILLDEQGRVKVADFGLSFLLPHERRNKEEILPGGTPYYMSPEQMLHEEIDIRSDIYSLGVTLFYMLTGIIPLEDKKKLTEILEAHLEGAMDVPRKIIDEFDAIPSGTKNAILKALEKDPDKRHQSCLEFSLAIREEAPIEMYSELLRLSLMAKRDISSVEREYLNKISEQRGLSPEKARALEENIRLEMKIPREDFQSGPNEDDISQEETDPAPSEDLEDTAVDPTRKRKPQQP